MHILKTDLIKISESLKLGVESKSIKRVYQRAIINYMIGEQNWDSSELIDYPDVSVMNDSKLSEAKVSELPVKREHEFLTQKGARKNALAARKRDVAMRREQELEKRDLVMVKIHPQNLLNK